MRVGVQISFWAPIFKGVLILDQYAAGDYTRRQVKASFIDATLFFVWLFQRVLAFESPIDRAFFVRDFYICPAIG